MRTKKLLDVVKTNAERILRQQYIDVMLETRKDRYDIKNINGHRETKLVENILSIVEVSFKECINSCYNILEKNNASKCQVQKVKNYLKELAAQREMMINITLNEVLGNHILTETNRIKIDLLESRLAEQLQYRDSIYIPEQHISSKLKFALEITGLVLTGISIIVTLKTLF